MAHWLGLMSPPWASGTGRGSGVGGNEVNRFMGAGPTLGEESAYSTGKMGRRVGEKAVGVAAVAVAVTGRDPDAVEGGMVRRRGEARSMERRERNRGGQKGVVPGRGRALPRSRGRPRSQRCFLRHSSGPLRALASARSHKRRTAMSGLRLRAQPGCDPHLGQERKGHSLPPQISPGVPRLHPLLLHRQRRMALLPRNLALRPLQVQTAVWWVEALQQGVCRTEEYPKTLRLPLCIRQEPPLFKTGCQARRSNTRVAARESGTQAGVAITARDGLAQGIRDDVAWALGRWGRIDPRIRVGLTAVVGLAAAGLAAGAGGREMAR